MVPSGRKLRLAVVTAFPFDPGAPNGGVEAVSVNLVQALAALEDLDIHVVTTDRQCPASVQGEWSGATIHRLAWAGGSTLRHAVHTGRRQISEYLMNLRPDVVHSHDTFGLMAKGLPLPRVFTLHGFIHCDTLTRGRLAWLRAQIWRYVETASWAEQPHIIAISPYVRERLGGIAEGMIHDIDNPVAESFFQCKRCEKRGIIFSAAHISRLKNTLGLLKGFARFLAGGCDAELRLAGAVSDAGYEREVHDFVNDNALNDCVHFLGRVNASRIREELASASVFALASLQENAPMGIAEAMAVGVPVVTSNRCGMPYMVRDGDTGFLINPNDPDDIAWRLKQLLGNDDLRRQMGEKARQIGLDRFHPDVVARRTREVYLRAVRGHHGRNG